MTIFLVILAGAMIALSNLAMRKSMDGGHSSQGFILFQMISGCLFSVVFNPILSGDYGFNLSIACFGLLAGFILASMLFFLGKALEKGPPGLTFSILSGATVLPGLLMAIFLGEGHGFPYTLWHALGSLVVLGGFLWAGKELGRLVNWKKWLVFCFAMFFLHVALLTLFQWRAFLLNLPHIEEMVSFFTAAEIQSQWFLPSMFLGAAIMQFLILMGLGKRTFERREISYGVLGGLVNSLGVFFLIWSTEIASPLQNAIIFPLQSVSIIVLCNFWGEKLYAEKVNWNACGLCAFGLIIATVDWEQVSAIFGFK